MHIEFPHAKRGELYGTFKRHFGPKGHSAILVAKAASRVMNATLSQRTVDRAFEEDPEAAAAEYGAEFRGDIGVFVGREAIEGAISAGAIVRAPVAGFSYFGFCDPSGGSSDAMTMAVAHRDGETVVLDCIGDRRPPFSPESVVAEFAETFKSYRVATIRGDRYGGEWPRERFRTHGIEYAPSDLDRSGLYLAFLPLLNSGRVRLLDNPRMATQFVGLERRTSRAGKDSVDHGPGGHDDVANAVAGALVLASARAFAVPLVAPIATKTTAEAAGIVRERIHDNLRVLQESVGLAPGAKTQEREESETARDSSRPSHARSGRPKKR